MTPFLSLLVASANAKAPSRRLWQCQRGMQGVRIGPPTVRSMAEGRERVDGTNRPNNQPAGIWETSNTQCQVVRGWLWPVSLPLLLLWVPLINRWSAAAAYVAWLSPSPVPVRLSRQSSGQPNCRRRQGGQWNDRTIHGLTMGYDGVGGRWLEYLLTALGGWCCHENTTINCGVWWRRREMIGVFAYCFRWLVLQWKHNNHQLLAHYTTNATAWNNSTTTATYTDGQGTSGASSVGARGEAKNAFNNFQNNSQTLCLSNCRLLALVK